MTALTHFQPLPNALHQEARLLHKKREREERRQLLIEGEKLCREALQERMKFRYAVVPGELAAQGARSAALELRTAGVTVYQTPRPRFEQICDASTPQGIVAVLDYPPDIPLGEDEPFIALDGVADPGNVGTIIRAADWFGIRAVVLGAGCADRFHPKVLRATMGAAFRCATIETASLADTLRERFPRHRLYGASARAETPLEAVRFRKRAGIVLGGESHGISPAVEAALAETFAIEGAGAAESLNVAIAAGIIAHRYFAVKKK